MTLTLTIVGKHFHKLGTRLMILPDHPTVEQIRDEILRWTIRLEELEWISLFTDWRCGVCDASIKLDRKELP